MAITPKEAQRQLIRMGDPKAIRKALTNAMRRSANQIRKDAIQGFRSRGIGRRIFGTKSFRMKDAPISVGKARGSGDTVSLEIKASGLAAIQEGGGRTAPHQIKPGKFAPKGVPLLVFRVPGALVITSKPVQHPGATHPAMPFLQPAIDRNTRAMSQEILTALDTHIDAALR